MRTGILTLTLLISVAGCATSSGTDGGEKAAPVVETPEAVIDPNATCADLFEEGHYAELHRRMTARVQGLIKESQLAELGKALEQGVGKKVKNLGEYRVPWLKGETYYRVAKYEKDEKPVEIMCDTGKDGTFHSFAVRPEVTAAPTDKLEYTTKTPLRLPMEGSWYVYWGGRSIRENYHAVVPDQRFALDLLVEKEGSTFVRDGTRNEDYHCWGEPITAPGPGNVLTVISDVDDNIPGQMNPAQAAGNHIIIDHENGEYSLLAHFMKGTITVKKGQWVTAGTFLGRCGNSGNSSEAHLHYHLQDAEGFGKGNGLPAQFLDVIIDGKENTRAEVTRGQHVRRPTRLGELSLWGIKFENASIESVLGPYRDTILERPIDIDPAVADTANKTEFSFGSEEKVNSRKALEMLAEALANAGLELRKKGAGFVVTSPWQK